MKSTLIFSIIIFGILLVLPVSAISMVSINNGTVENVGDSATLALTLNQTSNGLSGYNITISLADPSIATFTGFNFPTWAGLHDNSSFPSSSVWVKAADLQETVEGSLTNVDLGSVNVSGLQNGTTSITLTVTEIDDDNGTLIATTTQPGTFTVNGTIIPVAPTALFSTNVTSGTAPLPVKFTDASTGTAPLSYAWDFTNDGTTDSTLQNPTYTYSSNGTYTAKLTVNNTVGSNSTTHVITVTAEPIVVAPNSITNLHNTTYQQNLITWEWTDPTSADFDHVMVFFDGVFKTNVTKGTQTFTAGGLSPSTAYTIATHTVGTTGLINGTWVNKTTSTAKPGPVGSVYVYTVPSNATIYIDGVQRGTTTMLVTNVTAGIRNLTLTKPGYQTKTILVNVPAGDVKVLAPITLQPGEPSGETGSLYVYTIPSNATIYIDGVQRGTTTMLVSNITAGNRNLTLTKAGYQTKTIFVDVPAGDVKVLGPITLQPGEPSGETGSLYVYTIPSNATIYIDGVQRGTTTMLVSNVTAGTRNLTLTKAGYDTKTIFVDVPAGDVKVLAPITLSQTQNVGCTCACPICMPGTCICFF